MISQTKHRNGQVKTRRGPIARAVQRRAAKVPASTFLWMAGGAAAASVALHLMKRKRAARFIASWVPTLLVGGLSNTFAGGGARRH